MPGMAYREGPEGYCARPLCCPHPRGAIPGGGVQPMPRGTRWVQVSLDRGVEPSALCHDAWRQYRGGAAV